MTDLGALLSAVGQVYGGGDESGCSRNASVRIVSGTERVTAGVQF